jgi:hypothetical protein
VRRLIDEHLDRKANWGYHLWGLVILMLWMKRWKIEAPTMQPLIFAAQPEATYQEEETAWQPAPYHARTSEFPLQ